MRWFAVFWLLLPLSAAAGRPDYSHLSDEQLRQQLIVIAVGLAGFAGLGLYGWWRYRRSYVPAPGSFTPNQSLASVLAVIALVVLAAMFLLR